MKRKTKAALLTFLNKRNKTYFPDPFFSQLYPIKTSDTDFSRKKTPKSIMLIIHDIGYTYCQSQ